MKEEMLKTAAILETAYNAKVSAKGDEQRCGQEGAGEGDKQGRANVRAAWEHPSSI